MFRTLFPLFAPLFSFALAPLALTFAAPVPPQQMAQTAAPATVPAATDITPTTLREDDTQPVLVDEEAAGYAGAIGGYIRAQRAILGGDAQAALSGFLAALSEDSGNLGLQQDAFAAALLQGDLDTAVRLSRVLPAASDSDTMVWLVKLADAAKHGDIDEAVAVSGKLERAVPELLQFKLLQAYAERERGVATETVIRQMGPVEGISAQMARHWYHIGRMRAQTGDTTGAIAALEQAYALEPGSLFTTTLLSRLYAMTGRANLAEEVLARFRLDNPQMALLGMNGGRAAPNAMGDSYAEDVAEVLFDFGVLVWAQGADLTARQIFNLALWLAPDATYAVYYSAMIEESAGAYDNAADKYRRLAANPDMGDAARLRLAELYFKNGKDKDAMAQVNALLRDHPQDIGALRAKAEMAFDAKRYDDAAKGYRNILALLPEESNPETLAGLYFALGAAEERLGRIDRAEVALQRALFYVPASPAVLNYLGYMWVENGRYLDEAFVLLNSALMLAPTDGAIMDSVGWAYFMRGETEAALTYLEQAAELVPDDPVVMDHLGDAYMKQGRTMEAVWHWERAMTLGAKSPEANEDLLRDAGRKIKRHSTE